MLDKIISGGPTGVGRAALDVALALRLAIGGGCPQGRRAEDGRIPDRYPLVETPERNYPARIRRNIEDSDGTLILNLGALDGGTAFTVAHARQIGKPCRVVALKEGIEPATFRGGLDEPGMRVLNSSFFGRHSLNGPESRASQWLKSGLYCWTYSMPGLPVRV